MIKNKQKLSNKGSTKKKVIIAACALLLIAGAGLAWKNLRQSSNSPDSGNTEEPINYEPATESEKSESEAAKDAIIDQQTNTENQPTGSKKNVAVAITYWGDENGRFEVGAYANTLDSAGKCSLKLIKGSVTLTGSSEAVQNASTMSCGSLSVDGSKVTAGNWEATVTYTSASANGSLKKIIEVQ